ncbi:MAG: Uma2 family endonuclease [Aggregatilineales bacterium]
MIDPTMGSASAATAEKISFEDFLRQYDGQRAEWVDGEVVLMSPVSRTHNKLTHFFTALLETFAEARGLGEVLTEPFVIAVGRNGREADVMFVLTEHQDRIKETHLEGAADIIIEVVSPDSDTRDRVTKFAEYQEAGVLEYWLIDSGFKEALFYRLGDDGKYHRVALDDQGVFHSTVLPGLAFPVAMLWADPVPGGVQGRELALQLLSKESKP